MKSKINSLGRLCLVGGVVLLARTELAAADFDANLDKTFQISGGGKLTIDADRGSITVETDATDKVQVHVFRRVKGGSKEKAEELFQNHDVTFAQEGNKISVIAKSKKLR